MATFVIEFLQGVVLGMIVVAGMHVLLWFFK